MLLSQKCYNQVTHYLEKKNIGAIHIFIILNNNGNDHHLLGGFHEGYTYPAYRHVSNSVKM